MPLELNTLRSRFVGVLVGRLIFSSSVLRLIFPGRAFLRVILFKVVVVVVHLHVAPQLPKRVLHQQSELGVHCHLLSLITDASGSRPELPNADLDVIRDLSLKIDGFLLAGHLLDVFPLTSNLVVAIFLVGAYYDIGLRRLELVMMNRELGIGIGVWF